MMYTKNWQNIWIVRDPQADPLLGNVRVDRWNAVQFTIPHRTVDGLSEMPTHGFADPDFNPAHSAFYYARVLEIPTPPWYAYDAFRFGTKIPEDAPKSQQERAYTSPIWYTP